MNFINFFSNSELCLSYRHSASELSFLITRGDKTIKSVASHKVKQLLRKMDIEILKDLCQAYPILQQKLSLRLYISAREKVQATILKNSC